MVRPPVGGTGSGLRALFRRLRRPAVTVDPPPVGVERRADIPVTMPDGTVLRADVYLPRTGSRGADTHLKRSLRTGTPLPGRYPVVMCAHPYGKDRIPAHTRTGRGVSPQYHLIGQPDPIRFSAWTSFEAPDPAFWCRRGFALVNADLRGFGHSEGMADPLTRAESEDYRNLIEWAAAQPWSNGRVGLLGVSYLALSQYRTAALRPRGLAAICPWEGLSDPYRDVARPGGGREDGFMIMWSTMTGRRGRMAISLRKGQLAHPLVDDYWRDRTPELEAIETPMLVCGSFSDQLLHSRGSHEAFRRAASRDKWLYTHRAGKWSTFYSPAVSVVQHQFLEDFVADVDTGWRNRPRVRLAIHRDRLEHEVVDVDAFPPEGTDDQAVRLSGGRIIGGRSTGNGQIVWDTSRDTVSIHWRVDTPMDLVGSPWLALSLALDQGDDAVIFAGLRLLRSGTEVTFEGSYGFAGDMITHGQLRLSHRELDPVLSTPEFPVHRHDREVPMPPGELGAVVVPLLPQATHLVTGDVLRLDLSGRWFFPTSPTDGQFPARYQDSPPALVRLDVGGGSLHLPVWHRGSVPAAGQRPRAAR